MDSQELSSDIIFEILTRISSLKTLDRCKLVCKEWQRLIYEPSFMPTYCKRTNNVFGYYVQSISNDMYSFRFLSLDHQSDSVSGGMIFPNGMRILASSNQGILCCMMRFSKTHWYYVCKPITRQLTFLPNPKTRYETVAVALMILESTPCLRYKIVRLSHRRNRRRTEKHYRCEIFDSKVWCWREQKDVILPHEERIIGKNPAVSVSNYAHWLTCRDNVLAFDLTESSFHTFALPEPVRKNESSYTCKQLLDYQAKLGFTCLTQQGNIELWVIGDRETWNKKMTIDFENIERIMSPVGFYNADVAFIKGYEEVMLYNVRDCSCKKMKLDGLMEAVQCFQFRSDHTDEVQLPNFEKFKSRKYPTGVLYQMSDFFRLDLSFKKNN